MKKKIAIAFIVVAILAMGIFYSLSPWKRGTTNRNKLQQQMLAQLNKNESKARTLEMPPAPMPPEVSTPTLNAAPTPPPTEDEKTRAEGRKKRAGLPMGVVLWDHVPVYDSPAQQTKLFETMTGDFVRVFSVPLHDGHNAGTVPALMKSSSGTDGTETSWRIQPGLDIYLAATTKEVKPAGEHLPDRDGWMKKSDLHIFEPEDAREFLMDVDAVTLGNDTSFSTLAFYERAMKNPDPVVHRVIGPRFIALVLLHEDYMSSWFALYRDPDPKIRDAALSSLRARGVGNSREIIEDLITRLTELTKTRAQGETELEVLAILSILKESGHPRVPLALQSFVDAWKETQSKKINKTLTEILENK